MTNEEYMAARADARSTVCIPVAAVRKAGFQTGDEAKALVNEVNRSIEIVKWYHDYLYQFALPLNQTNYTVDRSGNLRITARILRQAGMELRKGDMLVLSVHKNKIIMKLPPSTQTDGFALRKKEEIDLAEDIFKDLVWCDMLCCLCDNDHDPELADLRKKIKEKCPGVKLSPYTDFQWGELKGKLEALLWVQGYKFDCPSLF